MKRTRLFRAAACLSAAAFFFCAASCSGGNDAATTAPRTLLTQTERPSFAPETAAPLEDTPLPNSTEPGATTELQTQTPEETVREQTTVPAQTTSGVPRTTAAPTQITSRPTTSVPTTTTKPAVSAHIHSYHTTTSEPTCTERGYVVKSCECGDKKYTYTADALGHDFSEFVVSQEASYTQTGERSRVCARCGLQETQTIPKVRPYESMDAALEMLRLINEERAKAGVAPLTFNNAAYPCVQTRAHESITVYAHTRPNGTPFYTVVDEHGLDRSRGCAENLYNPPGDDVPPADGHAAFMNSQAHRTNILNPLYKSVSICVLYTEDRTYFAQLFFG